MEGKSNYRSALQPGMACPTRRSFLQICTLAATALGLPTWTAEAFAASAAAGKLKPSVVWLHFQECTGCTESLLRTSHPTVGQLILDLISLDYHETLFAAAGHQAEAALRDATAAGKYVCVVEGSIPTRDGGVYCKIGGRTAMDMLREVADGAAAIIAIGSCASFGGLAAAEPNPTGAKGAAEILPGKSVINLPGCPANPYNLLGVVLQYATFGTLPALDALGRPAFAYQRTIHEDCPRRAHFDAGRFAEQFGDAGHRQGHCLYKLGCKGPQTHANCALQRFGETAAWPIGIGHPCIGCAEKSIAFRVPIHETVSIDRPTSNDGAPPINRDTPAISPAATGVGGLIVGGLVGAGLMVSRRLKAIDPTASNPTASNPTDKEA